MKKYNFRVKGEWWMMNLQIPYQSVSRDKWGRVRRIQIILLIFKHTKGMAEISREYLMSGRNYKGKQY